MLERDTMVIAGQFYGRMPNGWQKFDNEENYELWKWIEEAADATHYEEALKWA